MRIGTFALADSTVPRVFFAAYSMRLRTLTFADIGVVVLFFAANSMRFVALAFAAILVEILTFGTRNALGTSTPATLSVENIRFLANLYFVFWTLTFATRSVEELRSYAFLRNWAPAVAPVLIKDLRSGTVLLIANASARFGIPLVIWRASPYSGADTFAKFPDIWLFACLSGGWTRAFTAVWIPDVWRPTTVRTRALAETCILVQDLSSRALGDLTFCTVT